MEKKFCKKYLSGHRLELSFLNGGYPIVEGDKPDNQLNEEMEKDKNHFKYKKFDKSTFLELKEKDFSEVSRY